MLVLLVSHNAFKKSAKERWYQTYNLVLSLDRRSRQSSNPNVTGVPLPNTPGNTKSKLSKADRNESYIELGTKDKKCKNASCSKIHGILSSVIKQLTEATQHDKKGASYDNSGLEIDEEEMSEKEKEEDSSSEEKADEDKKDEVVESL